MNKTEIFYPTEERCFLMFVWLMLSDFMSGQIPEAPDSFCTFAYVEFNDKELEKIKKAKKLLDELPKGSSIQIPIKDSVIFFDQDTQPDELLDTVVNKINTGYARLKANEDMSGHDIDGNKSAVITSIGISFQYNEDCGTDQIAWDELNL